MSDPLLRLPPWAEVRRERLAHIGRVAGLAAEWSAAMAVDDVERERWLRAVGLHDALKDAPVERLRALAPDAWGLDVLRHGPAAAAMAARHGETDRGVLDAARYHSVGYAGWDAAGRMLYLADYLEPGRGFDRRRRAALAARVPHDPAAVLREVARRRILGTLRAGRPIAPETVAFWNAVACEP